MILHFSVSNFRSFHQEQTLDLLAETKHDRNLPHPPISLPGTEQAVLPVVAVYGANGAGKSNLVRALAFLKALVIEGTKPGAQIMRQPFLMQAAAKEEPTLFELRLLSNGIIYTYFCEIIEAGIRQEKLEKFRGDETVFLFERDWKGKIRFGELEGSDDQKERLKAVGSLGIKQNQLVLKTINEWIEKAHQLADIRNVLEWFVEKLVCIAPDTFHSLFAKLLETNAGFFNFTNDFLKRTATGVDSLRVESREIDGFQFALNALNAGELPMNWALGAAFGVGVGQGNSFLESAEGTNLRVGFLITSHQLEGGEPVEFDFEEESDGTKRLAHFIPILYYHAHQTEQVWVIDEIDRSLHSHLSRTFIEAFIKAGNGRGGQLIFTTHDTTLLDQELLRRDEVWFVEKDAKLSSHLYPLSDFNVRKDMALAKGYLQGRFGAIPFPGDLKRLVDLAQKS